MLVNYTLIKLNLSKSGHLNPLSPHINDNININSIHHDLKILNVDHQLQVQLSSLMWDYDHDSLPISLKMHFKKTNVVHNYSTRAASKGNLYLNKVNTVKYGIKSFRYQGVKVLNDLKNMSIYKNIVKKSIFLKKLKKRLIILVCCIKIASLQ